MLKMCEGYAKTQLMSGVTTIRTVGGVEDVDTKIRDAVLAGKIDGPRILAGNMAISVPGGHMAGSLAYEATSPEQARSFVRQIAKDQAGSDQADDHRRRGGREGQRGAGRIENVAGNREGGL